MTERKRLVFSQHALATMADRQVSRAEVNEVLADHQISEVHDGSTRYIKDELVVVVREKPRVQVILTVLWRRREQWTSQEMVGNRRLRAP